jgi:hypothetical protein
MPGTDSCPGSVRSKHATNSCLNVQRTSRLVAINHVAVDRIGVYRCGEARALAGSATVESRN